MKLLAVSDKRLPQLNNIEFLKARYSDVDVLVSCGDVEPDYLDVIASTLSVPMFYVRGNHDHYYDDDELGGIDLHRRIVQFQEVVFAGLEGSIRYSRSGVQYTEATMAGYVLSLMPQFLVRRLMRGWGSDVFVAHSPPRAVNDATDFAHRGFRSFRWLIRWARPRYFVHGHVDIYDRRIARESVLRSTRVININPSTVLEVDTTGTIEEGSHGT